MKKNHHKGQSVIEILVAMGVFVLSLGAAFQLFFGGQGLSVDSINERLATDYGGEAVSALQSIRNRNFSELTNGSHGLVFMNNEWLLSSSSVSDTDGIFTRVVAIDSTDDENVKIATTTVTWNPDSVRSRTIEIVEKLINWEQPNESSCKTEPLSGDWTNPITLGTGDIGSGNSGTDILVRYPYVYMSGTAASSAKPDLFVFDVSNPAAPVLVASKDIGSGGINTIYIQGNYLYAASPNDSKELVIFDISTPTSPTEVGSLNLSGTTDALSVVAFSSVVAIGRKSTATYEIAFISVANPASPSLLSEMATDGYVYDMVATSDRMFATSKQSDDDLFVFDITNPTTPVLLNTYDIPGTTEDLSLFLHYKGGKRNLMVGNEEEELVILGATTTSQMYVRDRISVDGQVNDIVCAVGDLAFIATDNSTKEFIVLNVHDPDNISEYASLNYPQVGTGIDYYDNKVYMSVRSNDSLRIITSQ